MLTGCRDNLSWCSGKPIESFSEKNVSAKLPKITELFQKKLFDHHSYTIKASHFWPPHFEASKQNFLKRKDLDQKDEFFGFSLIFLHSEYG